MFVRFKWNKVKRRKNLRKHGVDFKDCPKAMRAPDSVTFIDGRDLYEEDRFRTFAWLEDQLILIAHTEIGQVVRIISARKAKNMNGKPTLENDLERLRNMRDEDIDVSDIPEISAEQFARSVVAKGLKSVRPKQQVTLRLDADVLDWFRARGKGYQSRINSLLREYMKAHTDK